MLTTLSPYPLFFDKAGKPLDGGSLYFGQAGANPETTPVTMYWDRAGTQPAAQPIKTKAGYAVRNGTPAELFALDPFSLNVRNAAGQLLTYQPRGASAGSQWFNVTDFGAIGDGETDDSAAIQAAINAASPRGGVVYLPRGDYLISSGLTIDNSVASTGPLPDDYFARKASIMGDGMASTRILGAAGNYAMLTMIGSTLTGFVSQQFLRGVTFEKADKVGKVLSMDNLAYFSVENCYFDGGDEVVAISDCVVAAFSNSYFMFGNKGLRAYRSNYARPNALTFSSCVWAGNTTYGAQVDGPACLNIIGGTFESNGRDALTTYATTSFGIKVASAGFEGGTGLVMSGTYFEGNAGIADVVLEAANTESAAHALTGVSFNRIDATAYTKHNVYATSSAATAQNKVTLVGCGHKSFNAYPPDAARKYLEAVSSGGGSVAVGWTGALFEDAVESPSIPNALASSGSVDTAANYGWTGKHTHTSGTGDPGILTSGIDSVRLAHTSATGGTGGGSDVRSPFVVDHKVVAGTNNYEWSIVARNSNYVAGGGDQVAGYFQAYKYETAGRSWALVGEAKDLSGDSGAGILNALELNLFANGSSGAASRVGIHATFGKAQSGLAQSVARAGIELAPNGLDKTQAKLTNGIDFQINCDNALIRQSNTATAAYVIDLQDGGGATHFMRFYSGAMGAFQLVGSGGSLGTYVGRLKINIDGYTYWLPIYG